MPTVTDDTPRRIHLELNTPAELAIREAIKAVEAAGCHPMLSAASYKLCEALEKVADWVDADGGVSVTPEEPVEPPVIDLLAHLRDSLIAAGHIPPRGERDPVLINTQTIPFVLKGGVLGNTPEGGVPPYNESPTE